MYDGTMVFNLCHFWGSISTKLEWGVHVFELPFINQSVLFGNPLSDSVYQGQLNIIFQIGTSRATTCSDLFDVTTRWTQIDQTICTQFYLLQYHAQHNIRKSYEMKCLNYGLLLMLSYYAVLPQHNYPFSLLLYYFFPGLCGGIIILLSQWGCEYFNIVNDICNRDVNTLMVAVTLVRDS